MFKNILKTQRTLAGLLLIGTWASGCFDTDINPPSAVMDDADAAEDNNAVDAGNQDIEEDNNAVDAGDEDAEGEDVEDAMEEDVPEGDTGCENEPNACGGCATLEDSVGDPCGTCNTGRLACAQDNESLVCESDQGDEVLNACGGCAELNGELGDVCGTCNTGELVCGDDNESLRCGGDQGDLALNACGGCAELEGEPNEPCGTCGSGALVCVPDDEALECVGDRGDEVLNICGGCAELDGQLGDLCGTCDTGALVCGENGQSLVCDGDQGDEALNACGGCEALEGLPGDGCFECGVGSLVCDGDNGLTCQLEDEDSVCGLDHCLFECGDGVCDLAESCSTCDQDCPCEAGCGDGEVGDGEECDDGNRVNDDLCSNTCTRQATGLFPGTQVRVMAFGGGFAAVYRSNGQLFLQRFNLASVPIDPSPILVPGAEALPPNTTDLGGVELGSTLVVGFQNGLDTLALRGFNQDCDTSGDIIPDDFLDFATFGRIAENDASMAVLDNGSLVLTWSGVGDFPPFMDDNTTGNIFHLVLNVPEGPLTPMPVPVNQDAAGNQIRPQVAALTDGGFVIVWGSESDVRGRRFAPDGMPQGDEFTINANNQGGVLEVRVVALQEGRFAVAWHTRDGFNSYLRTFSAAGTPQNPQDVRINQSTGGIQALSGMAANGDDVILTVWKDTNGCFNGCSNEDSVIRFFTAAAEPIGAEQTLRSRTGVSPRNLVALENGTFLTAVRLSSNTSNIVNIPVPPLPE